MVIPGKGLGLKLQEGKEEPLKIPDLAGVLVRGDLEWGAGTGQGRQTTGSLERQFRPEVVRP